MTHDEASLKAKFEQAVTRSKSLSQRPDNTTLLKLYALFKQATEGDVSGARPGALDFVAAAKWDARKQLKGTSAADAMRHYIALIEELEGQA
ncbi:MAG TPA: acyl-CoA-binding protein [Burkholderiaceae bacterium]|nr:acyl-CoA-binding protein [Burkholderiaceae bacterium]